MTAGTFSQVHAIGRLLEAEGSSLAHLNLSSTAICGVDASGKPLLGCEFTLNYNHRALNYNQVSRCSAASTRHSP